MRRQELEELVGRVAEPIAAGAGCEVVEVTFSRVGEAGHLLVTIDKPGGVSLEDCRAVSESLSAELDRLDPIEGTYRLEVSSPGLERPLVRDRDFERFQGRLVRVKTFAPVEGRKVWEGRLVGLADGRVVLEVEGKHVYIPREQVTRARLRPELPF